MNEFVPQRTAAYISQYDVHMGELTVRETLAFSARCQGVGSNHGSYRVFFYTYYTDDVILYTRFLCADMLAELSRREKEANIKPDPDLDFYMKVRFL